MVLKVQSDKNRSFSRSDKSRAQDQAKKAEKDLSIPKTIFKNNIFLFVFSFSIGRDY